MMLHVHQQAHLEGACALPSLSNVLSAMRSSNNEIVPSSSAMWAHVQQLNLQQLKSQQLNVQQLNVQQLSAQQLNLQHLNAHQINSQQLSAQQLSMWGASSLSSLTAQAHASEASGHSDDHTTDSAPGSPSDSPGSPGECAADDHHEERKAGKRSYRAGVGEIESQTVGATSTASKKRTKTSAPTREAKAETAALLGAQYWPGRKWRERRDKKYAGEEDARQSSHLKVALMGLHKALVTVQGKTALVEAMREFLDAKTTPEVFAETIKGLVDVHNIIVPTGTLDGSDSPNRQRPYECDEMQPPISARRSRENKRSRNRGAGAAAARAAASVALVSVKAEDAQANGAWEALVSVCSML